jgi:hypothetical protein
MMASEETLQALKTLLQAGITVTAVVDETTLAKANQLPAALDASGGVRVAEQNLRAGEEAIDDLQAIAVRPTADPDLALSLVGSAALEKGHAMLAAPGSLYWLSAMNTGAAAYFQIHNAAAEPAGGSAPVHSEYVAANGTAKIDPKIVPLKFSAGCYACFSSTAATLTAVGAVGWFDAQVQG